MCNHSRLTPAKLTVTIRPVAPVTVAAVRGRPGRVKVTNHNDRRVSFVATDRAGCQVDARGWVRAHATRTFRVRHHTISWHASIGTGIADHGLLRRIALNGPAAPRTDPNMVCLYGDITPRM